jgi:hypothetical protein
MEYKWFAEKLEDAIKWGELFYHDRGVQTFYVVTASIPIAIVQEMFSQDKLDNIGKAICVSEEFLDQVKPIKVLRVRRRRK